MLHDRPLLALLGACVRRVAMDVREGVEVDEVPPTHVPQVYTNVWSFLEVVISQQGRGYPSGIHANDIAPPAQSTGFGAVNAQALGPGIVQ